MKEVVKEYKKIIDKGIDPPFWVLENVAGAYLYLEKPQKALKLYNKALNKNLTSNEGRMGKFYTLQELRRFNEAYSILDELDREQPDYFTIGKTKIPNWYKLEIAAVRGWTITHEERLEEANKYFWELKKQAPANIGIRTGLAHVYLWRGWPRKALKEFRIIDTLDPKNVKAKIGMMLTLNELAYKKEARAGAVKLYKKHPKDKHVQQLVRQLKVEEMNSIESDFVISQDDDEFDDITAQITVTKPLNPLTQIYGTTLWKRSSQEKEGDDRKVFYRRVGIGIEHIFNSSWKVIQQLSADYIEGDELGSYTEIFYTPNDYWNFSLSLDSFTTDVPLRARVHDIDARKVEAGITYRKSEQREYTLRVTFLDFSDSNERLQGILVYEQELYVRNNWRFRSFWELYSSKNFEKDVPYFNPRYDFSIAATLMVEHTLENVQ